MHRTLRFQLLAIVVGTVATVLAGSQWLDTSLSERALERDLRERAFQALDTMEVLWGRSGPEALGGALAELVHGSRGVLALDVFRLEGAAPVLTATTRADRRDAVLDPDETRPLLAGSPVARRLDPAGGAALWRVAVPLRRGGVVAGVAQADVSLAQAENLETRLRLIDGALLLLSITVISIVLVVFLERRVARPVAALVGGMRDAEAGALGARVAVSGGGELGFLARCFNQMLMRIEDLNSGLEARVRRATSDLEAQNRRLHEANEELARAQLELARSERLAALGQLAATIAHELGTPLNSVLGYTQLLRREKLAPAQGEKLAIVESQVQRMIDTIRSVLDRTRDRELARQPVDVEAVIGEALGLVTTQLAEHELTLRREVPHDLPHVPGDPVGMRQVLLNLLTNAIDATPRGGTITVAATMLAANGRGAPWLEISIRDTGPGMTPEEAERVFEPFYTTKSRGRGTGLGLAITEHLVRAHRGEVIVDSVPGSGTTMRVRLPGEAA